MLCLERQIIVQIHLEVALNCLFHITRKNCIKTILKHGMVKIRLKKDMKKAEILDILKSC